MNSKLFVTGFKIMPTSIESGPFKVVSSDNGFILAEHLNKDHDRYYIFDSKMRSYWYILKNISDISTIENLIWGYFQKNLVIECVGVPNSCFTIQEEPKEEWMLVIDDTDNKKLLFHPDLSYNNIEKGGACWTYNF